MNACEEKWLEFIVLGHQVSSSKKWERYPDIFTKCYDSWTLYCRLVTKLCPTLCTPMDCSMPDFPVLHHLPEFAQTRVHWVSDAVQLSHPVSSPSPPTFNLSHHQGLFQWVSSSHQVAKILEVHIMLLKCSRRFLNFKN